LDLSVVWLYSTMAYVGGVPTSGAALEVTSTDPPARTSAPDAMKAEIVGSIVAVLSDAPIVRAPTPVPFVRASASVAPSRRP
jgi:hypothetical protein